MAVMTDIDANRDIAGRLYPSAHDCAEWAMFQMVTGGLVVGFHQGTPMPRNRVVRREATS